MKLHNSCEISQEEYIPLSLCISFILDMRCQDQYIVLI